MPNPNAADLELVMHLRAGKHEALTELFRRYWQPLYFTAFYKLKSHELAEEIVQELFTQLWDKKDRLFVNVDEHFNLKTYLNRAVKNKVLNHIRRLVYDEKYWHYCKTHLPASESSTHELAEYNDLEEKLHTAMEQLSGKTKEIFVLHKLKGIPVGQISRDLNLSEKAVGYHLTKSVKELRSHLKDFI
jgi:RNA polymerase sigma-70 factor (ECF subfamily)